MRAASRPVRAGRGSDGGMLFVVGRELLSGETGVRAGFLDYWGIVDDGEVRVVVIRLGNSEARWGQLIDRR